MQFRSLLPFALLINGIYALHAFTRFLGHPPEAWTGQPFNLDGVAFYAYELGQQYPLGLHILFSTVNSLNLDYLYTLSNDEVQGLFAHPGLVWRYVDSDVLVYNEQGQDLVPLWRSYNGVAHFYSTDQNEGPNNGYSIEGIACWVYPYQFGETIPIYRWNLDNPILN